MSIALPKYHLTHFKDVLESVFIDFFNENQDCFVRQNGIYVFGGQQSIEAIEKFFMLSIKNQIAKLSKGFDLVNNPTYHVILGDCRPTQNILLSVQDVGCPNKLISFISKNPTICYVLREKDICIDLVLVNSICQKAFNHFFSKPYDKKDNVIFLRHQCLDSYQLSKVISNVIGKSNCIDLGILNNDKSRHILISLNSLIEKHADRKWAVNKDKQLKQAYLEVKSYLKLLLEQ